jgi:hypothetical protein
VTPNGKQTLVSFMLMGKYRVVGTFDDQNLLALVHTWVPNPVYGDMLYELRYLNYKDFGGVKYPTVLHIHQGDPRLMVAHNSMEITLTAVQPNVSVPACRSPRTHHRDRAAGACGIAKAGGRRVAHRGGTHNSLAVDFRVTLSRVIEAPLNEERSLAVIAEVGKAHSQQADRYVVNTHHHFDHSGGLRTYGAGTPPSSATRRIATFSRTCCSARAADDDARSVFHMLSVFLRRQATAPDRDGESEVRDQRRGADDRPSPDAGKQPPRGHAARLPPEGKDSGEC